MFAGYFYANIQLNKIKNNTWRFKAEAYTLFAMCYLLIVFS